VTWGVERNQLFEKKTQVESPGRCSVNQDARGEKAKKGGQMSVLQVKIGTKWNGKGKEDLEPLFEEKEAWFCMAFRECAQGDMPGKNTSTLGNLEIGSFRALKITRTL